MESYQNLTCVAPALGLQSGESFDPTKTAADLFTALDACGFAPAYSNVSITATRQNTYSFQFPVDSK
jgi:hypothetical protein